MVDSVPLEVRQAAAVNFKNTVKYHWVRPSCGWHTFPSLVFCLGIEMWRR
jgi:hypothetical protein